MGIAFTLFCIPFVSAGGMFCGEHRPGGREKTFSDFFDGFYRSVVTLATVGFGDQVQVTGLGRVMALGMIVSGIVYHSLGGERTPPVEPL